MTRRTRLFVSLAAGVLFVGLAVGLLASFFSQNLTLFPPDQPAELVYVRPDARLLAYANVRSVMDSELRRRLSISPPGARGGADRFREETGIDIRQDIDHLVVSLGTEADEQRPLVLARGRFDPARVEEFATARGGLVEEHAGVKLVVQEGADLALAFVEPALVAIGPAVAVRQAIDTRAGGSDVTENAEVMRLVRDVRDGDVWIVARTDGFESGGLPAEVMKQLPLLSWVSARGVVNGGLRGELRVDARDEASARNLQDLVRGLLALVRLQAGQLPPEFMDSLQLTGAGTTVSLSFSVPFELIDALGAAGAGPRRPAQPPPPPPAPPL